METGRQPFEKHTLKQIGQNMFKHPWGNAVDLLSNAVFLP